MNQYRGFVKYTMMLIYILEHPHKIIFILNSIKIMTFNCFITKHYFSVIYKINSNIFNKTYISLYNDFLLRFDGSKLSRFSRK